MLRLLYILQEKIKYDKTEFIFILLMWWRIVYGVVRIFIGSLFLLFVGSPFAQVLQTVMRHELIQDHTDLFITMVSNFSIHHHIVITYFLSLYLIFWGTVDIFLSINLLCKRAWAFPITIWLIAIFMVYEIYRVFHTHSIILMSFIAIDTATIFFIQREYVRYIEKDKITKDI